MLQVPTGRAQECRHGQCVLVQLLLQSLPVSPCDKWLLFLAVRGQLLWPSRSDKESKFPELTVANVFVHGFTLITPIVAKPVKGSSNHPARRMYPLASTATSKKNSLSICVPSSTTDGTPVTLLTRITLLSGSSMLATSKSPFAAKSILCESSSLLNSGEAEKSTGKIDSNAVFPVNLQYAVS